QTLIFRFILFFLLFFVYKFFFFFVYLLINFLVGRGSCCLFATFLSLTNGLRLSAGRPPFGFATPSLYRAASAFTGPTPSARTPPALSSLTSGLTHCRGASCVCRVVSCRVSRVACRVSRVACRVSRVACRVSRVVRRSTDIEECQKQD